jgi:hypothetical protein
MPNIEKVKKLKTKKKAVKPTKKTANLPVKKVKNTPSYYLCMGDNCHGKNIAKVAKDCKTNAPSLTAKRVKKFKELAKAAKVIGKFANDLEKVLPR